MKNCYHAGGLLALAITVGLTATSGVPWIDRATAQAPVTFQVFNPTGGFEVTQTFSPRLAELNGKPIRSTCSNSERSE